MDQKPKNVKLPKAYDGDGSEKTMKFAKGYPAYGMHAGVKDPYGRKPVRGTDRQRQAKTFGKNG